MPELHSTSGSHLPTHVLGNPKAQVLLLEYGDFECPYTIQAYPIVKQLQSHFGARLKIAFKHFPLRELHPHAERAAEAAEAAGEQGKFWEMHDLLFGGRGELQYENLLHYAQEIGLEVDQFVEDLKTRTFAKFVSQDTRTGIRHSVQGTPTFFINGERYEGEISFEGLCAAVQRALDEELIRLAI